MSVETPTSDAALLELLRTSGPMGVRDLSRAVEVTPTAIRQRLMRLMGQELIERELRRQGRGRPKHLYQLTEKGLRLTGSNFTDLALILWREIGRLPQSEHRGVMIRRIASALASGYADRIKGDTPAERLRSLGRLFERWRIPVSIDELDLEPVLTAHACPYPTLAEEDRSVCDMEQILFSELVGHEVSLTRCRLDGQGACQFHAR